MLKDRAAKVQAGAALTLLLLLAAFGSVRADDRFIGWQGEQVQPEPGQRKPGEPWIETISWSPRAFVYHHFLSDAECDHLIDIGSRRISRSLVVDSKTGESKLDNIRTSFGGSFGRGEDPVIATIEERIAEWTHIPPENGEPIQWFSDPVAHKAQLQDGNRYATVLMYLSDVDEGGETTLPLADAIDPEKQVLDNPSVCASKMGIAIRPRRGDALLFFDMNVEGSKGDRKALHASCPTLKGTKWTCTKWIHNKKYMGGFDALERAGKCMDTARDCASKVSQCDTDPSLIGLAGTCRKTCKDCVVCPAGDILCLRANMGGRRKPRH